MDRVLAHQGTRQAGGTRGRHSQDAIAQRPVRRLKRKAAATVSGLPWGSPAPLTWRPCQGGMLHRVVWQQVVVIRVSATFVVEGSHVSAHHPE